MKEQLTDLGIAIADDFLPAADFERVRSALSHLPYRRVDGRAPSTAWSQAEVLPKESATFYSDTAFDLRDEREAALDLFAKRMKGSLEEFQGFLGVRPGEEVRFNIRSWLYPPSSGLSWHRDSGRTGAFTFYLHATWSPRWGGELQVAEPGADDYDSGRFFQPKPNRLLLIKSGTPHRIGLVSPAAGEHVRLSLSGFFSREGDDEFLLGRAE